MQLSSAGESLIKGFEALKLESYLDIHGIPTIGWGHTGWYAEGIPVSLGQTCTEMQAEGWFKNDTDEACNVVRKEVLEDLTQNQFDALVSFVYNVGVTAFAHSTLLYGLNHGWSRPEVASQFLRWDYSGGHLSSGLENRRRKESQVFLSQESL